MAEPPRLAPNPEYWKAFADLLSRIEAGLGKYRGAPVPVYIAGGAAVHLYTGSRFSDDVDGVVGLRHFLLPRDLTAAYRGSDGAPRVLYWDRQYNDTLGILHEDAHAQSTSIQVPGVNPKRLDVRVLAPVDLAVSKLSRFAENDREDIRALAHAGLVDSKILKRRAEHALVGYIGRVGDVRISLAQACKLVDAARRRKRG